MLGGPYGPPGQERVNLEQEVKKCEVNIQERTVHISFCLYSQTSSTIF